MLDRFMFYGLHDFDAIYRSDDQSGLKSPSWFETDRVRLTSHRKKKKRKNRLKKKSRSKRK